MERAGEHHVDGRLLHSLGGWVVGRLQWEEVKQKDGWRGQKEAEIANSTMYILHGSRLPCCCWEGVPRNWEAPT